ncbi:MAG: hypothetical protein KDI13_09830 [Alphaproteobacteria bacterium]|nr:hypothetical protein [Alphaproteobacteria bacterium]
MSRIMHALERLDNAVGRLENSVVTAEQESGANVVDVDFVSKRLDRAISAVESILEENRG